jgi:hypothetical protein
MRFHTVELFSGTRSFSKVAKDYGHSTFTIDSNEELNPDLVADVRTLTRIPRADIVWASPPCEAFSVAAIGKNWNRDYTPKHHRAVVAQQIVRKTISLIRRANPAWWFIENPRGMLRKLPMMQGFDRHTVSYCQYGDTRMKPTDIWTNAYWWAPRPMCKNGDRCHEAAPRGARTGTQGIHGATDRGRVPRGLFQEIFLQLAAHYRQSGLIAAE